MSHQFRVYVMSINDGISEHIVNCSDNFSAIMISSAIYNGRVIDTEMIF